MVIEPGQDLSSYGTGVGGGSGGEGDALSGNNLQQQQQPPDAVGMLASQQHQQGGNMPPMNPGDHPSQHGPPRFPTTQQNPMFVSSRKLFEHTSTNKSIKKGPHNKLWFQITNLSTFCN